MHTADLFSRFSSSLTWNALGYLIYKVCSTALTFWLHGRLPASEFMLWANTSAFVYLSLLWLDGGLRKSIPRFAPLYASTPPLLTRFISFTIGMQLAILLLAAPLFYIAMPLMMRLLLPSAPIDRYLFPATALLITEGLTCVMRSVYHACSLNRSFTLLSTASLSLELITILLSLWYLSSPDLILILLTARTLASLVTTLSALALFPYRSLSSSPDEDEPDPAPTLDPAPSPQPHLSTGYSLPSPQVLSPSHPASPTPSSDQEPPSPDTTVYAMSSSAQVAPSDHLINHPHQTSSSHTFPYRSFLTYTLIMWGDSIIKSLSERNILVPFINGVFGAESAAIFKVAHDGALLFERTIIKTIGVSDTVLFAHIDTQGQEQAWQSSFEKLTRKIAGLALPFFGVFFGFFFSLYLYDFQHRTIAIVAMIALSGYLVEILLSPYERVIEVRMDYWWLYGARIMYLMCLVGIYWYASFVGLVSSIFIVHVVRLVSGCSIAYRVRYAYHICYPAHYVLMMAYISFVGVLVVVGGMGIYKSL